MENFIPNTSNQKMWGHANLNFYLFVMIFFIAWFTFIKLYFSDLQTCLVLFYRKTFKRQVGLYSLPK